MSNTPNQLKLHKWISYAKSGLRIFACIGGCAFGFHTDPSLIVLAFTFLGLAEILGIIEEMVVD